MTNDEIIDLAIKELKKSEKRYVSFSEFTFLKELDPKGSEYQRICYMLVRSVPFEKHTETAIKLSATGLTIINDYKDWFKYKKSLKPKKEYVKWGSFVIMVLALGWSVYQGIHSDRLQKALSKSENQQDSLIKKMNQINDTINYLKAKISRTTKEN